MSSYAILIDWYFHCHPAHCLCSRPLFFREFPLLHFLTLTCDHCLPCNPLSLCSKNTILFSVISRKPILHRYLCILLISYANLANLGSVMTCDFSRALSPFSFRNCLSLLHFTAIISRNPGINFCVLTSLMPLLLSVHPIPSSVLQITVEPCRNSSNNLLSTLGLLLTVCF